VIIFTLGISILTDFKRCVLKNACVINVIIIKTNDDILCKCIFNDRVLYNGFYRVQSF